MGGAAFLIFGKLDMDVFGALPVRKGLLNRVLRRTNRDLIKSLTMGKRGTLLDLPSTSLQGVKDAFRGFLRESLRSPSPSDLSVLNGYFTLDVISVFLRSEQEEAGTTKQYVQIGFSGCAGLAEISAELGAHWAEIWYRDRKQFLIRSFFDPVGFTPTTEESACESHRVFVPAGAHGYALFTDAVEAGGPYEEASYPPFEMDAAIEEEIGQDKTRELLEQVRRKYMRQAKEGKCLCGLCRAAPPAG
jgi:hypothetical protein